MMAADDGELMVLLQGEQSLGPRGASDEGTKLGTSVCTGPGVRSADPGASLRPRCAEQHPCQGGGRRHAGCSILAPPAGRALRPLL